MSHSGRSSVVVFAVAVKTHTTSFIGFESGRRALTARGWLRKRLQLFKALTLLRPHLSRGLAHRLLGLQMFLVAEIAVLAVFLGRTSLS